ncbi:radical SAM protein [Chloroflexota bacterium]
MNNVNWENIRKNIYDPETPTESWELLFKNEELRKHPAFNLPEETIIGIPSDVHIRKDSAQIIYYGFDLFDSWLYRLNSAQVVILSLFDGRNTLHDVEQNVADLSNSSFEAAWVKVRRFLSWLDYPDNPGLIDVSSNLSIATQVIDASLYLIKESALSARLDKPISLMLMATDKCFTDCLYCYACRRPINPSELLDVKRIYELIDEAADIGIIDVNLDGGDILARKEHIEIIQYLYDRGITAGISTKGYISKKHSKQLHQAGVRWMQVSLDSTEDVFDKLVGRTGYFKRTIETIFNLVEADISVRTNSIIVRESLPYLPKLIDTLMDLPLFNFKIAPAFGSTYRGTPDLLLTTEEKRWFKEQMQKAKEKYSEGSEKINWECRDDRLDISSGEANIRFMQRPMCSSGRSQLIISPDGKAITCEMSPQTGEFVVGDCTFQSISEVWDSDELELWWNPPRGRFINTPCYSCEEFQNCVVKRGQCWFDAYRVYGSPFAPNSDCPKAESPSRRWK